MTPAPSVAADKNIVDRRRRSRDAGMHRTIRSQREKLAERTGRGVSQRELMAVHARTILAISPFCFVLIVVTTGLLFFLGNDPEGALLWAGMTALLYLPTLAYAVVCTRSKQKKFDPIRRGRMFRLAGAACGLGWLAFVLLDTELRGFENPNVLKAVILLMVISAKAFAFSSLRGALTLSMAPSVFGFAYLAWRNPEPSTMLMAILLAIALVFFAIISRQLAATSMRALSYQAESVALVAELETQKSYSDEARRRAEEANLAKSRFLASMSHELRTPLNAILGFSEVMAEEVLGPMHNKSYKEYAGDIKASGEHLLALINQILDLSRIEAGRYELQETALDLSSLIEECAHMMKLRAQAKTVDLVRQLQDDMPPVFVDERSMRQIILNLLSNAVKFTPAGGTVTIKGGWTMAGGQYVSVVDNGPGIPEDEIPVVLSAFGQGSIAIKNAEEGTGLGLPIVQAMVEMHGGRFELKSRLREGTTVTAILPPSRVLTGGLPSIVPEQSDLKPDPSRLEAG